MRLRTWTQTLLLVITPCLCVVSSTGISQAQAAPAAPTADQVKEATTHFKKGSDFFGTKKFALALDEFKKSYAAVQSPNSHLYIARSLVGLGKHRDAYLEFDLVIAEADARAKTEEKYAPTRDTAKVERDEVAAKLAFVTVNVTGAPPDAALTIAGNAVPRDAWSKPTPVEPGSVDVTLDIPNKTPISKTLTLKAGAKEDVTLEASSAVASNAGGSDGSNGSDGGSGGGLIGGPKPKSSPLLPVAVTFTALGVGGFALFGVMGSMSNTTYGDLKTLCGGEKACLPGQSSQASDLVSKGHLQQTLANVGLIVGAVGVAAAVPLFIVSLKKPKSAPATTGLFIGPASATYRGTF